MRQRSKKKKPTQNKLPEQANTSEVRISVNRLYSVFVVMTKSISARFLASDLYFYK